MALMNQRLNAQDRNGLHDAGRAVHLHQLAADQGSVHARRPRARPGAGDGRSNGCARKCRSTRGDRHDASGGSHHAHRRLADDEGDGDGRSAAPRGRRGHRLRRRRAGFPDAGRRSRPRRTRRSTQNFTKYTPVGRHRRAEAGDLRSLPRRLRRRLPGDRGHRHAPAASRRCTTPRWRCSARATRSSRTRRTGRRSPSRSSWPTRRRCSCARTPRTASRFTRSAILDAITPRTRGIIINSPCNPTGALIAEASWRRSPEAAARQGIWVVVDLCYEKLIYDAVPHNLPARAGPALPRPGGDLRVGVEGVRDDRLALRLDDRPGGGDRRRRTRCRATRRRTSTSITQKAVVAALTGSQAPVTAMLDEYRKRRDQLHDWLTRRSAAALPQAGRRVLHVRRHQRRAVGRRLPHVDRVRRRRCSTRRAWR